tara:strand:+ start:4576 stop:4965 length:390 start_codon:yes stop_codon:yes gene_type:complete
MLKKNKILIFLLILFLYFLIKVNFLRNAYEIIFFKFEDRVSKVYGFCEEEGVGYINFIKKKYEIDDKIMLLNAKKGPHQWAVYDTRFKTNHSSKHYIIINYKKIKDKINFKKFKIINNIDDCYYLIKND